MRELIQKFLIRRKTFDLVRNELNELRQLTRLGTESQSEQFQDIWVLSKQNPGYKGYFVEFGAANGMTISNTYILENKYGWTGIVAEPCKAFHEELIQNRSCKIDFRAVWKQSGEKLEFNEMSDGFLSGIATEKNELRTPSHNKYYVETVTLTDLLLQHGAPHEIDFLSIDTEGGEIDILYDFLRLAIFQVRMICVEHNWKDLDGSMLSMLNSFNYKQEFPHLSRKDYWMVKNNN